jgi:hypothetical protein
MENINDMNTEVNIKLCPHMKKTISSHNSNSHK